MQALMKTLNNTKTGQKVRVQEIVGGRKVRNRLMELGIKEGTLVSVFSNKGGPMIIMVGNSRFALGRGVAEKIVVKSMAEVSLC